MLRPSLLLLLVALLAGCNSLGYDTNRRSNRGYSQRTTSAQRVAERAYPSWARVNDRGRTAYLMCHKNKKTQTVRTSAVRGHLNHGDDFGTCRSDRRDRYDRRDRRDSRDYRGTYNRRHDDDDD